jgi:hypothetical protein
MSLQVQELMLRQNMMGSLQVGTSAGHTLLSILHCCTPLVIVECSTSLVPKERRWIVMARLLQLATCDACVHTRGLSACLIHLGWPHLTPQDYLMAAQMPITPLLEGSGESEAQEEGRGTAHDGSEEEDLVARIVK